MQVRQPLVVRAPRRQVAAQALFGFGYIELEVVGLVRVFAWLQLPTGALPPSLAKVLNDPLDRTGIFVTGAKVPAFGIIRTLFVKLLR